MRILRNIVFISLCSLCLVSLPGCGGCGVRDKGKNSDYDRPRPSERKLEK